jgi:MFS superfamily sulfate permease-like transporter
MVSIGGLINISEFYEAWKHDKKDFIVMLISCFVTFTTESQYGLAAGIGASIIFYLADLAFSAKAAPVRCSYASDNKGIDVVRLEGDLTFIQAAKVKDFITGLHLSPLPNASSATTRSEKCFLTIAGTFDRILNPSLMTGVSELPKAIILDMTLVRMLDLTGLIALTEIFYDARRKGIHMVAINATLKVTYTYVYTYIFIYMYIYI